ncbi:ABC transporter substrate-binding protein [Streptomyces sp. CAU 1734]|uniref:ABC transporter substrate-binding protein n=1 Tax=Streptomyces sp. CAU 1734 TaxID=3140360 RepID=UPI003261A17F
MTDRRRSTTTRPPGTRRRGPAALLAAGAMLAAGCGVVPGTPGEAGRTVTVMTFAPEGTEATNMPGMPAMAKAYARWINARGGAGGHRLRVITCNERNTPQGAAACARRAVDENAVAVVGSYSRHGRDFMPVLEGGEIPFIGGFGISGAEFTGYLSYPVNGGEVSLLAGHGLQLADVCRRVALVRPDTFAGTSLPRLLDAGLAEGGRKTTDVPAAEDASDYGAPAARARREAGKPAPSGPERGKESRPGCVTAALGERTETFFDSFRRLPDAAGDGVRVSSVLGSVGQSLIDRTGGRNGIFEGAFLTGWYPEIADTRWDEMKRVVDEHAFGDNRIDPTDAGVQTTWIAYGVLRTVLEELDTGEVTPQKIAQTLNNGIRVTTGGLTPELRWGYDDLLGIPGYLRIVNSRVTFQMVRDGRLVAQREEFVDVGDTLRESTVL